MSISLNNHETRITELEKQIKSLNTSIEGIAIKRKSFNDLDNSSYIEFSNGLKIQWGSINPINDTTVRKSFPVTFSKNTSYSIVAQKCSAHHGDNTPMCINERTASGFGILCWSVYKVLWLAIGY